MKIPPLRESVSVAIVVVLCTAIVVSLVVLDKNQHTWMALLVYACVYVAIALVERRSGKN
jgi:Ca2+/Na+ antiporter